eukprot:1002437_1
MTPSRHYILSCFVIGYLVNVIHAQDYGNVRNSHHRESKESLSLDHFPNPLEQSGEPLCGRDSKSFVCDPNQFINSDTADAIDEILFNATQSRLIWCPTHISLPNVQKVHKRIKISQI